MKKRYQVAAFFTPLLLLVVPAFATTSAQWPPPVYEMPSLVPYDISSWSSFMASIKITIKAIGSTGLIILGVGVSVGLVSMLFHHLFIDRLSYIEGVKRREKNRTIKALDITLNRDAIVNEKAMDMQLNSEAKALFRARNPNADMEEKIYQRQVAYQSNIEFARRNPNAVLRGSRGYHRATFAVRHQPSQNHQYDFLDVEFKESGNKAEPIARQVYANPRMSRGR